MALAAALATLTLRSALVEPCCLFLLIEDFFRPPPFGRPAMIDFLRRILRSKFANIMGLYPLDWVPMTGLLYVGTI